ncbi:MAG: 5-formyltetrahydrofolate cyclo-ligase [Lachnospiraceae bacterium]|jgi:5-formyltetrahydrofolate cyclo-ligase
METKQDIRKKIFAKRRETTPEEVTAMSHIICETVCSLPEFQQASCIYAYADYNKEASTKELIEKAWEMGKRVAVPKTHGHHMTYYYLETFDQLQPGNFHVPEPVTGEVAEEEDALLIVPGVAFDPNRHRVGYGAGFYDRYLSVHTKHPTVAIAFEFQIVPEAPAEETDIFPTKVITEKRTIE